MGKIFPEIYKDILPISKKSLNLIDFFEIDRIIDSLGPSLQTWKLGLHEILLIGNLYIGPTFYKRVVIFCFLQEALAVLYLCCDLNLDFKNIKTSVTSAVAYGSTYSQACFGLYWPKHCCATQLT